MENSVRVCWLEKRLCTSFRICAAASFADLRFRSLCAGVRLGGLGSAKATIQKRCDMITGVDSATKPAQKKHPNMQASARHKGQSESCIYGTVCMRVHQHQGVHLRGWTIAFLSNAKASACLLELRSPSPSPRKTTFSLLNSTR